MQRMNPVSLVANVKAIVYQLMAVVIVASHGALAQELSVQTGHSLSVSSIRFSPDGKMLASSGDDNSILLWDVLAGRQIRALKGHEGSINQLVFHPTLPLLISISDDRTARVWDTHTGFPLQVIHLGHSPLKSMDIAPDGTQLAIGGKGVWLVKVSDWSSRPTPILPPRNGYYDCLRFSHDGTLLAVGGRKTKQVILYKTRDFSVANTLNLRVNSLAFDWNSRFLIGAGISGKLRRWDLQARNGLFTRYSFTANKWIDSYLSAAISMDNQYIAGGNKDKTVYVFDLLNGRTRFIIKGHEASVKALSFTPDGRYLASAGKDRDIHLWDMQDGHLVKTLKGLGGEIQHVTQDKKGNFLAIGDQEGYCKVLEWQPGGTMHSVRVAPTNWYKTLGWRTSIAEVKLAQSSHEALLRIDYFKERKRMDTFSIKHKEKYAVWNMKTGRLTYQKARGKGNLTDESQFVFLNYKKHRLQTLVFNGNEKPAVLRTKIHRKVKPNYKRVVSFALDPAHEQMAVISRSKKKSHILQVFQLKTGQLRYRLSTSLPLRHVRFLSDSLISLLYQNERLEVIDCHLQKTVYTVHSTTLPEWMNDSLLLLAEGPYIESLNLITGTVDTLIHTSHTNSITSLSWLPEKAMLISGSRDGTVRYSSLDEKKELLTLVTVGERDNIYLTTRNYYFSTKNALRGLGFAIQDHLYSFEQFDLQYNRPDIVLETLGKVDTTVIHNFRNAYEKRLFRLHIDPRQLAGSASVPSLTLNSGEIPIDAKRQALSFQVSAQDDSTNLDRLMVYVNEVPVFGSQGKDLKSLSTRTWNDTVTISLSKGRNQVQVFARNAAGGQSLAQNFETYYRTAKAKPNLYVISIGVSAYRNGNSLKYADKDARDIRQLFSKAGKLYRRIYTRVLLNEHVLLDSLASLKQFLASAEVDDVVVLFLAGHGLLENSEYYFGAYDVNFNQPAGRGIPYTAIEGLLDNIKPRKKILLMDTCHSGEYDKQAAATGSSPASAPADTSTTGGGSRGGTYISADTSAVTNVFELSKLTFADLSRNVGAVVISSAGGDQAALEADQWKNGAFTYCLKKGILDGLADLNKDKKIMISELREYVFTEVKNQTKGKQRPTARSENLSRDIRIW